MVMGQGESSWAHTKGSQENKHSAGSNNAQAATSSKEHGRGGHAKSQAPREGKPKRDRE